MSNKINFYIASSYLFKVDCIELSRVLEEQFICEVLEKWWNWYHDNEIQHIVDCDFYNLPEIKQALVNDFKAIDDSDIIIVVVKDRTRLDGALIELGYALAKKKTVIIYGKIKKSAMLSSCIHVDNHYDLFTEINNYIYKKEKQK